MLVIETRIEPAYSTMSSATRYLTITLHAHLPYVVNHGTWPHGLEWLHEAAAETYLPLLRLLNSLRNDGIRPRWNIDFSPVLLEQLTHPVFLYEFPEYLRRKVRFAEEDEAFFSQAGEQHFAWLARQWQQQYRDLLKHFESINGDIVGQFRQMEQDGLIDLLTCSATHGYNPLLGTDESVRAQTRLAVATHRHHFGTSPKGMWLPECGYRPAGYWQPPVTGEGDPARYSSFYRIGVEQALSESSLRFFFVDAHLVSARSGMAAPYSLPGQSEEAERGGAGHAAAAYQAHRLQQSGTTSPLNVFPRDPRTGLQVWSGEHGYPADGFYLDFHKKRWPGGHRYWQVTGAGVDLADKRPYRPEEAAERAREHASHFVSIVRATLDSTEETVNPPLLTAPFDAELFGHWWFEGTAFLEHVARELASPDATLSSITCSDYLDHFRPEDDLRMPEGSWGAGGDNRVWLNADTEWTYRSIYTAEHQLRDVCTAGHWRDGGTGERIVKQMCRELLLLESSDWQFLITTGAARDYAEKRFHEHDESFKRLLSLWRSYEADKAITEEQASYLATVESIDSLFPEVNPEFWVRGAHA